MSAAKFIKSHHTVVYKEGGLEKMQWIALGVSLIQHENRVLMRDCQYEVGCGFYVGNCFN